MQTPQQFINVSIFSICLCLFTAFSLNGGETSKKRFSISGTVMDVAGISLFFDIIEAKNPKTEKEFRQISKGIQPLMAKGVTVIVQSASFKNKIITDSKGSFTFTGLPAGEYIISVQAPSRSTGIRGVKRMAQAQKKIRLNYNNLKLKLRLRSDLVTIKGRITNVNSKPIEGARVMAVEQFDDPSNMHKHRTWSTKSDIDGYYELQGIEPASIYRLAGSLQGGSIKNLNYVSINVKHDNFVQNKNNIPKLLIITEEQLISARRFLKILSKIKKNTEGIELLEKKGLTFPASKGNTITGIDIVLKKAKTKAK